ncbi:MAG: hypothetical protein CR966_00460 [Pseudomonadales bacterium]|nr:MAG: hypothetical protein CR966_00460 [Pseudomonadales bacterium]
MDIKELFNQAELSLIMSALQVYKTQQENEEHGRKSEGLNTEKQHEVVQMLEDIEEKLYQHMD